jgi:hypothetical protein
MENDITIPLIIAGVLAGGVNFFVNYIELPFSKSSFVALIEIPPLKSIWWIALIGYMVVGIAGAFLAPVVGAIVGGLKGLDWKAGIDGKLHPSDQNYYLIVFGYGLIFGYSASRLLVSLLGNIIKTNSQLQERVSLIEKGVRNINPRILTGAKTILSPSNGKAQEIITSCENNFEQNKSDCSAFVKAVAQDFNVPLNGQADDIVGQMQGTGWTVLQNGVDAKNKADTGWFVVAGLKGADNVPPQAHGHVAIIVAGDIAQGKYPTGYWGKLDDPDGAGRDKTINWAWNKESRDKVIYSGMQV